MILISAVVMSVMIRERVRVRVSVMIRVKVRVSVMIRVRVRVGSPAVPQQGLEHGNHAGQT